MTVICKTISNKWYTVLIHTTSVVSNVYYIHVCIHMRIYMYIRNIGDNVSFILQSLCTLFLPIDGRLRNLCHQLFLYLWYVCVRYPDVCHPKTFCCCWEIQIWKNDLECFQFLGVGESIFIFCTCFILLFWIETWLKYVLINIEMDIFEV